MRIESLKVTAVVGRYAPALPDMPAAMQALTLLALLLALLVQTHKYWRYAPALPDMPAAKQALTLLAELLAVLVQTHTKNLTPTARFFFVVVAATSGMRS